MSDRSTASSSGPSVTGASATDGAGTTTAATSPTTVDARGLSCPMPVIELAKAISSVEVGAHVRLLATDPAAKVDVPVWCRMQQQRLHSQELDEGAWSFLVERMR